MSSEMVFVGVKLKPAARAALERARGERPISQFVRDALRAECLRCGVDLPRESSLPSDRAGKGGVPSHRRYKLAGTNPADHSLNERGSNSDAEPATPFCIGTALPAGTPDTPDTSADAGEGPARSLHARAPKARPGRGAKSSRGQASSGAA